MAGFKVSTNHLVCRPWSIDHQTPSQFPGNKLMIWRKRPKPTAITNTCQEREKASSFLPRESAGKRLCPMLRGGRAPGLMVLPSLLSKASLLQNSKLMTAILTAPVSRIYWPGNRSSSHQICVLSLVVVSLQWTQNKPPFWPQGVPSDSSDWVNINLA